MRLNPLVVLVCGSLLLGAAWTMEAAQAAGLDTTLAGNALAIDSPCARHVDIQPDAALHDRVAVSARAEHQEELDQLLLESREGARIRTKPDSCWQPDGSSSFSPTLELVVRVPAKFAVSIDESGAGHYSAGRIGGPLTIDLSGAAEIAAGEASTLTVDLSGAGSVDLAAMDGDATIDISGHGRVTIGHGTIPKLTSELSGAGRLSIGAGRIGSAALAESGVGDIHIGAEVGDATVDISGAGTVHFAKVTGAVQKEISGVGTVSVGE